MARFDPLNPDASIAQAEPPPPKAKCVPRNAKREGGAAKGCVPRNAKRKPHAAHGAHDAHDAAAAVRGMTPAVFAFLLGTEDDAHAAQRQRDFAAWLEAGGRTGHWHDHWSAFVAQQQAHADAIHAALSPEEQSVAAPDADDAEKIVETDGTDEMQSLADAAPAMRDYEEQADKIIPMPPPVVRTIRPMFRKVPLPLAVLQHQVTGAIERGEARPVVEMTEIHRLTAQQFAALDDDDERIADACRFVDAVAFGNYTFDRRHTTEGRIQIHRVYLRHKFNSDSSDVPTHVLRSHLLDNEIPAWRSHDWFAREIARRDTPQNESDASDMQGLCSGIIPPDATDTTPENQAALDAVFPETPVQDEKTPICEGDILYASWDYDQTNIDWFKCVKRKGDWLTLQPLEAHEKMTGDMTGESTPGDPTHGNTIRRRAVQNGSSGEICKFHHNYGIISKWDGKPKHTSHYA